MFVLKLFLFVFVQGAAFARSIEFPVADPFRIHGLTGRFPAVDFRIDFMHALDSQPFHVFIAAHLSLREGFPPEEDIDSESEDAESDEQKSCQEYFHGASEYEVRADWLVAIYFADHVREDRGEGHYVDLALVLGGIL